MNERKVRIALLALALAAVACTCGPLSQVAEIQSTVESAQQEIEEAATEFGPTMQAAASQAGPTLEAAQTMAAEQAAEMGPTVEAAQTAAAEAAGGDQQEETISQWASAATASSQYGDPDWSAAQATGMPDTHPQCGDIVTAWASATSGEVATLTLSYETPVNPIRISIFQTLNPGAVSEVTVTDTTGQTTTVYTAQPAPSEACPLVLDVDVTGVQGKVDQVTITIDQSNHNGWNEIDAVQLVGTP